MGDDREEIARIIDHEGYWERLDSCNHALATVSMTDDQRRALTAVRDDELRGTASSLAKADAILARQGPGPGEAISDDRAREFIEAAYAPPTAKARELMEGLRASTGPGEAVAWLIHDPSGAALWSTTVKAAADSMRHGGFKIEPLYAATPTMEA